MFKRFRRLLLRIGLNPLTVLVVHLFEILFIGSLILWKIIFWDYGTLDSTIILFSGPILCFLCVAIVEGKTLMERRKSLSLMKNLASSSSVSSIERVENGETLIIIMTKAKLMMKV